MTDGFLHRYFLNNASRPLLKWVHYFDIYERHFERFRGKAPVMLEIGVAHGGSVAMWKEYFGPDSTIIGLDITPDAARFTETGIDIFIGSQDDQKTIDRIFDKYQNIDIVLDDGSHMMRHMTASFELLFHRISPTGVYVVEDTHTCYWPEYEGGLNKPESFIEFAKTKIDELNAHYTRDAIKTSGFTRETSSICFYDSVVVFEKRPQGKRLMPITEPME